ncbi:MAG: PilN domain-containing protein [bacterium]
MKNKGSEKTRINLLPLKDKERIAKNRKRLVIFSVITLYLIFIFLLDLTSVIKSNRKINYISRLNQQLYLIKTKNTLNETFVNAINNRKALLASIQKKITIIDNLKKLKVPWNKKISDMVAAQPLGVWMSGLLLQNGAVIINGNSVSLNRISVYINRLKKTGLFKKISLTDVNREIISGNTFYSFNLKAIVNFTDKK